MTPEAKQPADWMFLQPGILDLMHEAVITTDMQGVITGCNQAARRIYGFHQEELAGRNVASFYAEEDRHIFYERLLPAVTSTGEFKGEVRNRTESGDYIYIHLSVGLLRDGSGVPVGMVGFSVDVTAQKLGDIAVKRNDQMEQELVEKREDSEFVGTLTRAVERSGDAILITEAEPVDLPGPRIVFVNPAFERMTGYAAHEVIGQTPRILQGPRTDRAALQRIREALKAWRPVREEMVNYRKDGSEFTVELSIVPVADDRGWFTHWFAIQRDTTEQSALRRRLEESESRLRDLVGAVPHFLWIADAQGRREWVSEPFAAFVGAKVSDCLGDGWIRFVHPDDRNKALRQLELGGKQRRVCTVELRLRSKDGDYVWFLKQGVPRLDAEGKVTRWMGSFTDISERMAAEMALKSSEERAHLGMAVAKLALADIDYATGINHLSAEAAHMYGLGDESLSVPREVVHGTFHPDDLPELTRRIAECLNPRGSGWFDMDHRVVWPSGEVRWLRVRKQVFFKGEGRARRPERALLAAFDVTEPKRAEIEVRENEKRFRDLAESLPQFVWVTDGKGEKTYCNLRYLDYVGGTSYRTLHRDWHLSVHPEDREAAMSAWKLSLETGAPYIQEYRLRRFDGEYRHFLARAVPVRNEAGEIERWLGSSTDVQDRKVAEDTLRRTEKLAVVGRMASNISHEINNPLAGLVNLLYLMSTGPELPKETQDMLAIAQELLARVTEATTRTLLFHRQSTKQSGLRLAEAMDSLLAVNRPLIEAKQVGVATKYRSAAVFPCYVGEVRQALAHMMNNALDALGHKGKLYVRVRDSHAWGEPQRKGIRVTLADTGGGIPAGDLPFIFDAFFTTKGLNGTGLGLWISKEIVERHAGFIRLKSSTGEKASGTVVHVFFPCPW